MNTISGTLKHGLKIGETVHKSFVIRELSVTDLLEAEKNAQATQIHAFNVEQLRIALVSVGDHTGPFTPAQIGRLKKNDYYTLLTAMSEVDAVGEGEQGSTATS